MTDQELLDAISGAVREAIKPLETDVAAMRADIAAMRTDVAGLKTDVADLRIGVAGVKTDVSALKTDVVGLKTEVSGLRTDVGGLRTDVASLKEGQERISHNIGVLMDAEFNPRVQLLNETQKSQIRALEQLKLEVQKFPRLEEITDAVRMAIKDLNRRDSDYESRCASYEGRVAKLEHAG